jgi:hypothetical protein
MRVNYFSLGPRFRWDERTEFRFISARAKFRRSRGIVVNQLQIL